MKKIFISALLLAMSGFTVSCADVKKDGQDSGDSKDTIRTNMDVEKETDEIESVGDTVISITGKVIHINNGKDGYTAKVRTSAGPDYYATISIPNMDNAKNYKAVKEGDIISVSGEPFKVENDTYIKVKSFN